MLPGIGKIIKTRRLAKYAKIQPEELVDSLKLSSVDDWYKMAPEYQDKLRALHYHDTKYDCFLIKQNVLISSVSNCACSRC